MMRNRLSILAGVLVLTALLQTPPTPELPLPEVRRDEKGVVTLHGKGEGEGALLLHTLDGTDPVATSAPYLAPIELACGGVIKARASYPNRKFMGKVAHMVLDRLPGHQSLPSTLIPVTQDRSWPQYDWAKRHDLTSATVRRQQPKILFIGDSLIHFFGGEKLDGQTLRGKAVWDECYAPRNAGNLGCGWDKTENVLWRLQHGAVDGIWPDVVVLMIGTNNVPTADTATDIVAGITAIVTELHQRLPASQILLLGILPQSEKLGWKRDKISEVNREIAKLDGTPNVSFLDIGPAFLKPDGLIDADLMPGFLHPNEKGYRAWAEAMEPTLKKLLEVD
ncbi:MAG TPA: GDSL-type esterase/lipase family protein [Prosthecobacter sp.]